jgi:putative aminopeptidase FrvX
MALRFRNESFIVSIVHRDDLDNAVKLVIELVKKLDESTVKSIKGMGEKLHF